MVLAENLALQSRTKQQRVPACEHRDTGSRYVTSVVRRPGVRWIGLGAILLMQACSSSGTSATAENREAVPMAPANAVRQISETDLANAETNTTDWLSYGRTWSEQRYSPLNAINRENVSGLKLEWYADLDTARGQEATPLVIDGKMYFTTAWSKVKAYDAVTGEKLWDYDPDVPGETGVKPCCDVVNRGLAAWGDKLYFGSLDGRLIALDRETGEEVWVKETVDRGELGDVLYVNCVRVNLGRVRQDENAMWSLAPHDISVALHFMGGMPESVSAQGLCYVQPEAGIYDVVFLTLRFPDGRAAQIHVSWLDPHKKRQLTIVGTRKMLTFDDMAPGEKVRVYDKGVSGVSGWDAPNYESYGDLLSLRQGDILSPHIPMREPLRMLCEDFARCVDTGEASRTPGSQGVQVLQVLAAGQQSLDLGGVPVTL